MVEPILSLSQDVQGTRDGELRQDLLLPPAGGSDTISEATDIKADGAASLAHCPVQVEIVAPTLTAAQLADGQTVEYYVERYRNDTDTDTTKSVESVRVGTQTGADGEGAGGGTYFYKPHANGAGYYRIRVRTSAGAGDPSAATVRKELVFY